MRRASVLSRYLSPRMLFFSGVAALPAYLLLQHNLIIRFLQALLFGFLAVLNGKRLQWWYFILLIITITIFHVLIPSGKVLFTLFRVPVTHISLQTGVFKALTVVGMVFLSLASVSAELRLPGRIGALIAKVFWCFEQIIEYRKELSVKHLFVSVERLLLRVYRNLEGIKQSNAIRSTRIGTCIAVLVVLLQWAAVVWG